MELIKKIVFRLYVVLLMVFTVWYGHFVYPIIFGFEGKEAAVDSLKAFGNEGTEEELLFLKLLSEQSDNKTTNLGYKVIEQPYIERRFHHIGFDIQQDKTSLCIRCHGNIPHDKSEQVRSFLNMHTFFLACETCHVTNKDNDISLSFNWYDKEDGSIAGNPLALQDILDFKSTAEEIAEYASYGNYGSKIAPTLKQNNNEKLLYNEKDYSFIDRYLDEHEKLNHEQKSQMKRVIHRKVQTHPVKCKSCHQLESPYIPFDQLGYSPSRINELTDTEILSMIDKIKKNYEETTLIPGGDEE